MYPKEYRNQCLEHLPALYPDEERIVEIGFETTADGEHSIMIDATYLPDTDITLEDTQVQSNTKHGSSIPFIPLWLLQMMIPTASGYTLTKPPQVLNLMISISKLIYQFRYTHMVKMYISKKRTYPPLGM